MRVQQGISDLLYDSVAIGQHIIVPEPQNPVTSVDKKFAPPLVRIFLRNVLATIEFHDKPSFWAAKIGNVPAYRMLTAKFRIA